MSTPSIWLKDGAAALKQGNYTAAIPSLKAFCESSIEPQSPAYFQGHKWLVQAYVKAEQTDLALAICLQMAESRVPDIQAWASQAIPALQETISAVDTPAPALNALNSTAVKDTISQAIQSFRRGDNSQVIALLEPLSDRLDPCCADYGRVQMTLAKAYQAEGELAKAIALSQVMMGSDRDDISIWGKQFLNRITPPAGLAEKPKSTQTGVGSALDSPVDSTVDSTVDSPIDSPMDSAADSVAASVVDAPINSAMDSAPDAVIKSHKSQINDPSRGLSRPPEAIAQSSGRSSVSGILYQPPSDALPIPAQYQPNPAAANRVPNDYTAVIQSALSHGVLTLLFSWLMYALFPQGIALLLNLMRLSIPAVIYCVATDPIAKENAKEATNYAITMVVVTLLMFVGGFLAALSFVGSGSISPMLVVLAVPLVVYGPLLVLWPIAATVICIANPDRTFHYPRWLVWHALK